ncbi:cytochrome c oxidase subunit IV [Jatrophihabitans sp. GAS493]|uniref:cytochrome c oxidase subunit 4 n=1 Tax=Jatrophihabitans sp. GAS493 TaxID=1907575 RepID=UPI000BB6BBCD|nr:cytochrome c oxidase subunit 4 [Jatrophihabitans sp. GAS493]SOD74394.1 cytochrome c oxidase subunit IV [Jatrophihabitans sp. GAS493]
MKVEARLFLLIALFCFVIAGIYGFWTNGADGHVEYAGLSALILSGGLMGLAGSFFWFVSRRIDPRPEDLDDAEIAEGAGELGFFSPGSYWPVGIALSATVTGAGAALVQVWLMLVGVVLILTTVSGLLFEYYIGGRQPLR